MRKLLFAASLHIFAAGCASTHMAQGPVDNAPPSVEAENNLDEVQYIRRPGPVLSCQATSGHHIYETDYTCPIGGEQFEALALGTHSTYGSYLDWEPVSYLEFPVPIPVCPSNGFVMYKDDFSEEELVKLGEIIESPEYKKDFESENTSYYLFGRVLELSGGQTGYDLWWIYLQSTWEADMCGSDKYAPYAFRTIGVAREALPDYAENDAEFWMINILIPNLYRRMGDFESAEEWMQDLGPKRPAPELESADFYNLAFDLLEQAILEKRSGQIEITRDGNR